MARDPLSTRLCRLLGITYPIVQAGMGEIARAELAAAVSNAGGLGVIGAAYFAPEDLRAEIRRVRALTDRPFGVNLLLWRRPDGSGFTEWVEAQLDVVFSERPPVLTTGLGNPGPAVVERAHALGMRVISLVGNVRSAVRVEQAGVDAVVAQGTEAGGHNSRVATMPLVPRVVDAVRVPVIAAGGIADGRGLVAALALGASGVLCGTVFVASEEAHAHVNYKRKIVEIDEEGTAVSRALSGKPARLIKNRWLEPFLEHPETVLPFPEQWERTKAERAVEKARVEGRVEEGPLPAGQVSGLIDRVRPAGEIVANMVAEARQVLEHGLYSR
ncbi:MAG TPA: nitronate monooxygenase [Bacillota bacterium]